jgi:hypothetical protein
VQALGCARIEKMSAIAKKLTKTITLARALTLFLQEYATHGPSAKRAVDQSTPPCGRLCAFSAAAYSSASTWMRFN